MEVRWRFDGGSMEVRWRFDGGSMEVRWRFDGGSMEVRWRFDGGSGGSSFSQTLVPLERSMLRDMHGYSRNKTM